MWAKVFLVQFPNVRLSLSDFKSKIIHHIQINEAMIDVKKGLEGVVVKPVDVDRLTVTNAGELKKSLALQFSSGSSNVYLDLSNIKYMDSTGVSVLISGVKSSREQNRAFILRNVQPEVHKLLSLMKIDKIIDIE